MGRLRSHGAGVAGSAHLPHVSLHSHRSAALRTRVRAHTGRTVADTLLRRAMEVAVIGGGNVGATLARGCARAGHRVVLGVRTPGDAKHAALAPLAVKSVHDAAAGAAIVVLAMPWGGAQDALSAAGDDALRGKMLALPTPSVFGRLEGLRPSGEDSGGEQARAGAAFPRIRGSYVASPATQLLQRFRATRAVTEACEPAGVPLRLSFVGCLSFRKRARCAGV